MSDFERPIRERLRGEANTAPSPRGLAASTVRRARVKRLMVDASSALTIVAITGALAVGLFTTRGPTPGPAAPSPSPSLVGKGAIAFVRWGSLDTGIYVMTPNGSDAHRILAEDYPYAIDEPTWSPDGERIAFHGFYGRAANETGGLFVVDADGSDVEEIAAGGSSPSWAPDGREIAFYGGDGFIHVISSAGGDSKAIAEGDSPSWSPDGDQIVYAGRGIFVMDADGGNVREIVGVDQREDPSDPAWSPDGSRIAFTAPNGLSEDIDVVNVDGTGRRTVTEGRSPAWSPDGSRIVFERKGRSGSNLYSIDLDGSGLVRLTSGSVDHSPAWTGAVVDSTPAETACPELVPARPYDERPVTDEASRWGFQHMPNKVRSFRVHVERAHGEVMGPCDRQTWRRSWIATIHWHYRRGSGTANSASLASSTVFVGRATNGESVVWFGFH
jgi:TolB protein